MALEGSQGTQRIAEHLSVLCSLAQLLTAATGFRICKALVKGKKREKTHPGVAVRTWGPSQVTLQEGAAHPNPYKLLSVWACTEMCIEEVQQELVSLLLSKKPTVCCLGSLKLPCAGLSWCESHNGRVCQCLSSCIWGPRYQQQAGWGRRTHPTSSYAQGHQQVQGQDWEGHGASALSLYGRAVAHHTFAATLVLPRVHRAATGASCV